MACRAEPDSRVVLFVEDAARGVIIVMMVEHHGVSRGGPKVPFMSPAAPSAVSWRAWPSACAASGRRENLCGVC